MAFDVNDLRANLSGGGARPTLFDVVITFPAAVPTQPGAGQKLNFTCQAAEIPPSTIGTINVPYFGRMIPYPGDRTFSPWQVGIINDEDFLVRDAIENWHNIINARQANVRGTATDDPSLVMAQGVVTQYTRLGINTAIRQYTFNYMWPSQVSGIELSWSAQDQIETFPVVFNYAWWDVSGTTVLANQS